MYKYISATLCSTSENLHNPEPQIPNNKYFRKMIEKFSEYRETLADEADKKEFDGFLEYMKKLEASSSGE